MDSDEKTKMKTLLSYLVEHNRDHSQEVKDWAKKAREIGELTLADDMLAAADAMDKAIELLNGSLNRLEGT